MATQHHVEQRANFKFSAVTMHARQNLTFIRPMDRRALKRIKEHRGGVSAERTYVHTAKSAKMESQKPNRPMGGG